MTSQSIMQNDGLDCRLVHHGAAAGSSPNTLAWITNKGKDHQGDSSIVYASHGILNICSQVVVGKERVWTVRETLRASNNNNDCKRIITSTTALHKNSVVALSTGFSDGSVHLWWRHGNTWNEQIISLSLDTPITCLHGVILDDGVEVLAMCSSTGAKLWIGAKDSEEGNILPLLSLPASTVHVQYVPSLQQTIILVGTAASRHNRIHVFWLDSASSPTPRLVGSLRGHEGWLTSFAWHICDSTNMYLASGSQDCKIRLWEFNTSDNTAETVDNGDSDDEDYDDDEARLEIDHSAGRTNVSLEALLYGHEEAVTSVVWHPDPQGLYNQDRVLLSSSMDRTMLLWTSHTGIWTPLTRVGAAGGILGGSIGSTMLGFVGAAVEPIHGRTIVGHGYGGALHFWSLETQNTDDGGSKGGDGSTEELAIKNTWKATPCITGHFGSVVDCCWEASAGAYLLTASADQTCRLWAPLQETTTTTTGGKEVWVEMARPQVHGYSLNTITSLSSLDHLHLTVSGADEKEIRVFDAPLSTTRRFPATGLDQDRPERAYIPSLGLSNKASPDEEEEDMEGLRDISDTMPSTCLPLERDLGVETLWPEVRKLYGHNTEIFRLTSVQFKESNKSIGIVASSSRARDAVDASIRLWDAESGKCIQVLEGGHKSTVAALAFSSDGRYLASAGKDRRLCVWKRKRTLSYALAASVPSAHKRIIWSVDFCPHYPEIMASASRDGAIKIWRVIATTSSSDEVSEEAVSCEPKWSFKAVTKALEKDVPVTAIAFAPVAVNENALLAVGLETGHIEFWSLVIDCSTEPVLRGRAQGADCHAASITKLAWRPHHSALLLASSSVDNGCRLFNVNVIR